MPITATWASDDDKNAILLVEFHGKWTWDDFHRTREQIAAMLESQSHLVHSIIDFTHSGSLPLGSALSHGRSALRLKISRGSMVIVAPDMLIRTLVNTLKRAYSGDIAASVQIVGTRAEAEAVVAKLQAQVTPT